MALNSLSVSQLNEYIKGVFDDELILQNINLFGEIYEFSVSGSNTYITLREGNSIIQCLHFGALEDFAIGAKVRLFGSVNYFTKGGRISFIFKSISLTGEGELYAQFVKLKSKLKEEGLFNNKLLLPKFVENIAIVTSESGAVIHDFVTTVYQNGNVGKVDVFPSRVQGLTAVEDVCTAIKLINDLADTGKKYDVIVIARGGGSDSDLEAFNSEPIARAVASSKIPIISAVGHETDITLCDYCATERAGTPSIAGEIISNINFNVLRHFNVVAKKLIDNMDRLISGKQRRLSRAARFVASNAQIKIALAEQNLQHKSEKLCNNANNILLQSYAKVNLLAIGIVNNIDRIIENKQIILNNLESALDKNSPLRIFSKGYAKVTSGTKTITSINEISNNQNVDVYLSDGKFSASVNVKNRY